MIVELIGSPITYFINEDKASLLKKMIIDGKKLAKINDEYVPIASILRIYKYQLNTLSKEKGLND